MPAAADTIKAHLSDTRRNPQDYDAIFTGDLGGVGKALTEELLRREGIDLAGRYEDCGLIIYRRGQDVHAGGSGCACSALVFGTRLMKALAEGRYRRVLLIATGALHSPTTWQQGESIPCIAHAVAVEQEARRRDADESGSGGGME
ncbi:MAG: hypothetical protein NUV93_04770 [Firmicutes bacterium]|nr:hypothetical protein [Bacillota bacterium]